MRSDAGTVLVAAGADPLWYAPADAGERDPLPAPPAGADGLIDVVREVGAVSRFDTEVWQPTREQLERLRSLGYLR